MPMPKGRPASVDQALREAHPTNTQREVSSAPTPSGVRAPVTSARFTVSDSGHKLD